MARRTELDKTRQTELSDKQLLALELVISGKTVT